MMNAALINNRYRILDTLGRGGFGETYLVEDMHMPSGRQCVLKQLKPIVQQPAIPLWMKERFQREAAILEELGAASSQIPELYAYFSEDQEFYLVQELIEGENLGEKWQREGNFSEQTVTKILSQILPVLDFIHSRKIVHRDIKPENIIIRNQDDVPVLIDFGAVKETLATTVQHNSSGVSAAIGTPGYMASEQAAGRPVYSSDLYSLGLTAIFLLTGKAPQELEIDPQTGEFIWQPYATKISPELINILNRAIKFHPRDRFAHAQEMLSALQPNYTSAKTGATVKVAPAFATGSKPLATVAYPEAKKGNWLSKIFWFLLVAGGLTVGTFTVGFYLLTNLLRSPNVPSPQVTVKPKITKPDKPILFPSTKIPSTTTEEIEPTENSEAEIVTEPTEEATISEANEPVVEEKTPPEVAILQPKPQPEIKTQILTTGTSESQLVSTLGNPTYQRDNPQKNSKILIYRNASSDNVNLTYHTDSQGQIKQADVALSQDLSLGAMQDTLTQLLNGNAPADAKNKLRNVYNRSGDRYAFRAGNIQGSIFRDSKNRVNISIWE